MLLQYVGHSCWYFQAGGYHFYTDIWLENEMMGGFRRFPDFGDFEFELPKADYILLSSHHWDQLIPETLLKIDKKTHILCPDNWQLITMLQKFEFVNIHVVEPWQEIILDKVKIIPTANEQFPEELGWYIEDVSSAVWNLGNCAFNIVDIYKINELSSGNLKLCLCPYQVFDRHGVISRHASEISPDLIHKNSCLLKHLDCSMLIPSADGLWYPPSKYINQKLFLNTPFEFLDRLVEICPEKQTELILPFDEIYLSEQQIELNRFVAFKYRKLLLTYFKYRMYEQEYMSEVNRISFADRLSRLQLAQIYNYFGDSFWDFFDTVALALFRQKRVVWSLKILGTGKVVLVDFFQKTIRIGRRELLKKSNCGLIISGKVLISLLNSSQLLSRLNFCAQLEVWGQIKEFEVFALDVLRLAGFDDYVRLDSWLQCFIESKTAD